MLRSLFSGVSGMKNNQTKMDVIANNIANVSTTAFKAGRVLFQDILSQTIGNASSPTTQGRGGINPMQIGLGMQVSGIDTITNQGAPQPTGRPLDNCIEGEGYFIISDGIKQLFTRDGSFNFDANFNIVNSDGYKVMGYTSSGMLKTIFKDMSAGGAGINWLDPNSVLTQDSNITINGKTLNFTSGKKASEIVDAINASSIGVSAKLDNVLGLILTPSPGVEDLNISGDGDFQSMNTNRSMQYSDQGVPQIVVKDNLASSGGQNWSDPSTVSVTGSDTITINGKRFQFISGASDPANGIFGVTSLQDVIDAINSQSDVTGVKAEINGGLIFTPVGNTSNITVSDGDGIFKGMELNTDTLSGLKIPPVSPKDPDVKINNFTIEANGTIKGIYEDGSVVELGKIALAKFANPAGLLKAGGNNYTVSANSGIADIGSASVGGRGDILQSMLEMSNVDLANEFTDMIITSRAFQANSRSITTSDEMLQELLNLKR